MVFLPARGRRPADACAFERRIVAFSSSSHLGHEGFRAVRYARRMSRPQEEAPLVGTLRFVFVMGVSFAILWLGMYFLLRGRW